METNKLSLVAVSQHLQEVYRIIDEAGGEVNQDLEFQLDTLSTKMLSKVDSYAYTLDQLKRDISKAQEFAAKWRQAKASLENALERLKLNAKEAMRNMRTTSLDGDEFRLSLQHTQPKLVIEDERKLLQSSRYSLIVTETVLNKDAIREDLAKGLPVEGARFEPVEALYIRSKQR